jgi:hypothetical protein
VAIEQHSIARLVGAGLFRWIEPWSTTSVTAAAVLRSRCCVGCAGMQGWCLRVCFFRPLAGSCYPCCRCMRDVGLDCTDLSCLLVKVLMCCHSYEQCHRTKAPSSTSKQTAPGYRQLHKPLRKHCLHKSHTVPPPGSLYALPQGSETVSVTQPTVTTTLQLMKLVAC